MNWIAIVIITVVASIPEAVADSQAIEVMKRLQELLRSNTNIARYSMRVETPGWQRTVQFESWDDRPGRRLFIRINSPRKDKGTAYLKRDGGLWMYLPKLERNIRIPPTMMLSSWMGSNFTYDDLIKVASVVNDYTHKITARDQDTITIESHPKPDAAVVWGKLVHVITHDGIPVSEDFYDEDGQKRRSLKFEDVRELGGRLIPLRWVMHPLDSPGKQTILQIEAVQFDPPIANAVFTPANMQRGGR